MRYLRIFFYIILSLLLLVITAGLIIAFFYEREVKEYFNQQLNKQLNTVVIIEPDNIQFSIFKNFPYASLEFYDVVALDALPKAKDTLLKAGNISMQFNILDIYREDYKIKKLEVSDGDVLIKIDKKGRDNYHFWKAFEDTTSASNVTFALEKVLFKKMNFSYLDKKNKLNHSLYISEAHLSGEFSSENYRMKSEAELNIRYIKSDTITYISDKPVALSFSIDVNKNNYQIHKANVKIADLLLQLDGKITDKPAFFKMDIDVSGKDMDIQSVFSLLPEQYKNQLADYESDGELYFKANIKGELSSEENPAVKADFGINNGEITQSSSSIILKDVVIEGVYENRSFGKKQEQTIEIKKLSALIGKGKMEGSIKISDRGIPSIEAVLRAETELNDITEFFKIDTLENSYGEVRMNAMYKGLYRPGKDYSAADYRNAEISGDIVLKNAGCKIKNSTLTFDSLNGTLVINNSDFILNNIKGIALNSDFSFDGTLKNIIPYLMVDKELLWVNANFTSDNLDVNQLLFDKQEGSSSAYSVSFSEYVNADLNTQIEKLSFRKFQATDISGRVQIKNKKLIADPLTFKAVDGEVSVSGMIDASQQEPILITCDASLKKLNINKLFYQCENFGQDVMVDKNLQGYITSDIKFASVWSSALDVDLDKIYAYADILIEKGELIKYEPMKALSRFVKLSELENIKFSTLKNTIEIRKQKIYIPKMEVNSSALNITCSGTHSFDNEIDYHVKVLLNDLLSKKARSSKKENDEFGVIEDDGLGRTALFFSMTGTVDDPVIKYDRKGAKEKLKEDIKEEKQTLKNILKEEFGWFKNDSTVKKSKAPPDKKKEDEKFIIKWDEEADDKEAEDDDF